MTVLKTRKEEQTVSLKEGLVLTRHASFNSYWLIMFLAIQNRPPT